jgi:hypothetical protein
MYWDIHLYTLCYYICCLLGACMRCTRLCSLKPGVTKTDLDDVESNRSGDGYVVSNNKNCYIYSKDRKGK